MTTWKTILVVEDNAWDADLARETLEAIPDHVEVRVLGDGEAAMSFLRGEGSFSNAPRPALVILDLNLPRKDGREVLAEIKGDPRFRRIPVVIFTSSLAPTDVATAYDLHANGYLHKPFDPHEYERTLDAVADYWLRLTVAPEG